MLKVHQGQALSQDRLKNLKIMIGWDMYKNLEDRRQRVDKNKEFQLILSGTGAVLSAEHSMN